MSNGILLIYFEPPRRSEVRNFFLNAVRRGAVDPHDIVAFVRDRAMMLANEADESRRSRGMSILEVLDAHPEDAIAEAESARAWERMSPEEKRRHKEERSHHYRREYMAKDDATAAQLGMLQKLSYAGPQPMNKLAASDLIGKLVQERAA